MTATCKIPKSLYSLNGYKFVHKYDTRFIAEYCRDHDLHVAHILFAGRRRYVVLIQAGDPIYFVFRGNCRRASNDIAIFYDINCIPTNYGRSAILRVLENYNAIQR